MFSDTFEKQRERAFQYFMHRRAIELIVIEKMVPVTLHRWLGFALGVRVSDRKADAPPRHLHHSSHSHKALEGQGLDSAEAEDELLGGGFSRAATPAKEWSPLLQERWLPMLIAVGNQEWLEPVDHKVIRLGAPRAPSGHRAVPPCVGHSV